MSALRCAPRRPRRMLRRDPAHSMRRGRPARRRPRRPEPMPARSRRRVAHRSRPCGRSGGSSRPRPTGRAAPMARGRTAGNSSFASFQSSASDGVVRIRKFVCPSYATACAKPRAASSATTAKSTPRPGSVTRFQVAPPSCVAQSSGPYAQPSRGLAKRIDEFPCSRDPSRPSSAARQPASNGGHRPGCAR